MTSLHLISWKAVLADLRRSPAGPRKLTRMLGSLARGAALGHLVSVPVERCTDAFAGRFGGGWQRYRALAEDLLDDPEIPFEETRWYRFFRAIDAPTYTDMLTFHDPSLRASLPRLPYGSYPWGPYEWYRVAVDPTRFYDRSEKPRRTVGMPSTRPGYTEFIFYEKSGEVDDAVRYDFEKIRKLVASFRETGYRPLLGRTLFPTAGVLATASGDVRYLVRDGNHRLAILAALGCRRVWLRLDPRRFPRISEGSIHGWPWVRSGLLRVKDARRLFRLYFELDGSERAHALGVARRSPIDGEGGARWAVQ